MVKRRWAAVLAASCFAMGAGGMYGGMSILGDDGESAELQRGGQSHGQAVLPDELHKVQTAYQVITERYVEKVDQAELVEGAIDGMVGSLEDPYSAYMDAETAKQFDDSLDSSFEGIGTEITVADGKLTIVAPFKDSPAEKAGLKPKDQIVSIDGESVDGLTIYEATQKIRGKKGTTVTLSVMRSGLTKPLDVKVKRDTIPIETVFAEVEEAGNRQIGVLEITSFSEDTAKDFKEELKKLEKKDIDGLIIDVRGNPGGFLTSVENILKELVTENKPYLQIEEKDGRKVPYFSEKEKVKPYPISVLVDEGSASASEILAGALKEAEGYKVIGQRSFGKGTVQQPVPLGDGSNLKLTTHKWLTPEGNWIHGKGIMPDIEVKQPDYFYAHPLQVDEPLKREMNDDRVKSAQMMLEGLGYAPGRTDGYFSEETEKAVRALQIKEGLKETGLLDKETASRLEERWMEEMGKEKNDLQLQAAIAYMKSLER
ncbi:Carboxyl-terminal protease [Bacillus thermotolerans]|uniref:C-terminal processing peptidase n=1 Tax=Bacillus thermotolerans TaxID=1221996 RepID=A0A0F5I7C7_BACTR|nr:S41 family peptidase [Bacillus thermotolerans]KKB41441.1 Carboxyl-terminal protease [Bacillus thermotolerans]KKB43992.1 Carboxyl-terminal protease [Bacillus thermotolerans]